LFEKASRLNSLYFSPRSHFWNDFPPDESQATHRGVLSGMLMQRQMHAAETADSILNHMLKNAVGGAFAFL